jgi:hypothetical protein
MEAKASILSEPGAGNEARTRDLNLGKVALYQLSYSRISLDQHPPDLNDVKIYSRHSSIQSFIDLDVFNALPASTFLHIQPRRESQG